MAIHHKEINKMLQEKQRPNLMPAMAQ